MLTEIGDLPVFSCSLDKRPLIGGGFKGATVIEPPSW
jgi:hypothetical protein